MDNALTVGIGLRDVSGELGRCSSARKGISHWQNGSGNAKQMQSLAEWQRERKVKAVSLSFSPSTRDLRAQYTCYQTQPSVSPFKIASNFHTELLEVVNVWGGRGKTGLREGGGQVERHQLLPLVRCEDLAVLLLHL